MSNPQIDHIPLRAVEVRLIPHAWVPEGQAVIVRNEGFLDIMANSQQECEQAWEDLKAGIASVNWFLPHE